MIPNTYFTNREAKGLGVYAQKYRARLERMKHQQCQKIKRRANGAWPSTLQPQIFCSSRAAETLQLRGGASGSGAGASVGHVTPGPEALELKTRVGAPGSSDLSCSLLWPGPSTSCSWPGLCWSPVPSTRFQQSESGSGRVGPAGPVGADTLRPVLSSAGPLLSSPTSPPHYRELRCAGVDEGVRGREKAGI